MYVRRARRYEGTLRGSQCCSCAHPLQTRAKSRRQQGWKGEGRDRRDTEKKGERPDRDNEGGCFRCDRCSMPPSLSLELARHPFAQKGCPPLIPFTPVILSHRRKSQCQASAIFLSEHQRAQRNKMILRQLAPINKCISNPRDI